MYAIIKNGGKQYKVQEGDYLNLDRIDASPKDKIVVEEVLAVNAGELIIGTPFVEGAKVELEVIAHGKDKKIVIFKKRRRKDSKLKKGFRREFTRVKVIKNDFVTSTSDSAVEVNKSNTAPIADGYVSTDNISATTSTINIISGENVHFDGSASSDPDGNAITYQWIDLDGIVVSTDSIFDRRLFYWAENDRDNDGTVRYVKTLHVIDSNGATSTQDFEIIVHKPTVDAGDDQSVKFGTNVTLSANVDSPDESIVSYAWKDEDTVIATTASFSTDSLSVGTHTLTVTITDLNGNEFSDTVIVNIQ